MAAHLTDPTGRTVPLPPRCVIGSGATCHVRVDSPYTSYAHALLSWDGANWSLSDLGSVNGTRVNDSLLQGSRALVDGDRLRFGGRQTPEWRLSAAGAPEPFAVRLTDGAVVTALDGGLMLPSDEAPEAAIYLDIEEGWRIERDGEATPISHEDIVALTDPWRVSLPALSRPTTLGTRGLRLAESTLFLRPSPNYERAEAWLEHGGDVSALGVAAHWLVAWTIAAEGARSEDEGWVENARIARSVGIPARSLDTYVSRIRNQLHGIGVEDAHGVVEASPGRKRIATGRARVIAPDAVAP